MKKYSLLISFFWILTITAQQKPVNNDHTGHYVRSKFAQMYDLLPTPNTYRSASGAPGKDYYQNKADYKMDIRLIDDDKQPVLKGSETITYYNNSPDNLEYLWVQLEQNRRETNSYTDRINDDGSNIMLRPGNFISKYTNQGYKGGYHIEKVTDKNDNTLDYTINFTMMRIDLPTPLKPNEKYTFNIDWWYNINNFTEDWARSGYEKFDDGSKEYIIAQFFPRMAVYDDVNGWQNLQFIKTGEFTLPFGNYEVNITAPANHILDGTGVLTNRKDILTKKQYKRYLKATKSFDKPVFIVTPDEAKKNVKNKTTQTKTWKFKAQNVRDFAFASSIRFIYDMMAGKLENGKTFMAGSLYPPEGEPLWSKYSTITVAHTVKTYSKHLFPYPYPKALSVNAFRQGMEYPMICWNYGRPDKDGKYTDNLRNGMIKVITHEVGHNFFPMIINSDERQWMWMDEGFNIFMELLTEMDFEKQLGFSLDSRGLPKSVVPYMKGDQSLIRPIMANSDILFDRSMNAYSKPTAGLYMLREVIMGRKLFDKALKIYANRWKFKHPEPQDFFRTMEDASAVDLDWFWRGWFYTTWVNDMAIKKVDKFYVTDKPTQRIKRMAKMYGMKVSDFPTYVSLVTEDGPDFTPDLKSKKAFVERAKDLKKFLKENFSKEEIKNLKAPKYFYRVILEQKQELVMPVVLKITYKNGTTEQRIYPAKIWRYNEKQVSKMIPSDKEIVKIELDPENLTADIDMTNNIWPKKEAKTDFNKLKEKIRK